MPRRGWSGNNPGTKSCGRQSNLRGWDGILARPADSQPEVSRLLRFHGTSPIARQVRRHAAQITKLIKDVGGSNVRIFGSVAAGTDTEGSDVDLLFDMGTPLGLMELGRVEAQISRLLGVPVDLIPSETLRPDLAERVLAEAVAL